MRRSYVSPEYEVVIFSEEIFLLSSDECDCYDPTDVVCDDCRFDN